jgi:hypothetical protein
VASEAVGLGAAVFVVVGPGIVLLLQPVVVSDHRANQDSQSVGMQDGPIAPWQHQAQLWV